MGPLTESMTRLLGEIVSVRGARLNFIKDLGQDVADLKAELRRSHQEMAHKTRTERRDFIQALGRDVADLMAGFRQAHADMARVSKKERQAAVGQIRMCVNDMCQEMALDLAGARRAWRGPSPAERRAKDEAARRARAEEEQRVREAAERERQAAAVRAQGEGSQQPPGEALSGKEETGRPGKKKG